MSNNNAPYNDKPFDVDVDRGDSTYAHPLPTPRSKPKDFDSYWNEMLHELGNTPGSPEEEQIPIRSSDFATTYGIRLTSIGPYRLFGYLSVPNDKDLAPFPTLFYFPNYSSVVNPLPQGATHELRRRYATFTLGARGQRNSNKPFEATFPGLMTVGIDHPSTYIYRGIIGDCCRGIEYLHSRPDIDPKRTIGIGDDLTLISSGLVGKLSHISCGPGSLYKPLNHPEILNYIRFNPDKLDEVSTSLSYFDSRWFNLPEDPICLITGETNGGAMGPDGLKALLDKLGDKTTFYETQKSAYKDGLFKDAWIANQFGFDAPVIPKLWQ